MNQPPDTSHEMTDHRAVLAISAMSALIHAHGGFHVTTAEEREYFTAALEHARNRVVEAAANAARAEREGQCQPPSGTGS